MDEDMGAVQVLKNIKGERDMAQSISDRTDTGLYQQRQILRELETLNESIEMIVSILQNRLPN